MWYNCKKFKIENIFSNNWYHIMTTTFAPSFSTSSMFSGSTGSDYLHYNPIDDIYANNLGMLDDVSLNQGIFEDHKIQTIEKRRNYNDNELQQAMQASLESKKMDDKRKDHYMPLIDHHNVNNDELAMKQVLLDSALEAADIANKKVAQLEHQLKSMKLYFHQQSDIDIINDLTKINGDVTLTNHRLHDENVDLIASNSQSEELVSMLRTENMELKTIISDLQNQPTVLPIVPPICTPIPSPICTLTVSRDNADRLLDLIIEDRDSINMHNECIIRHDRVHETLFKHVYDLSRLITDIYTKFGMNNTADPL